MNFRLGNLEIRANRPIVPLVQRHEGRGAQTVRKRSGITCDDCYFRRAGLCALVLAEPCPTFRRA